MDDVFTGFENRLLGFMEKIVDNQEKILDILTQENIEFTNQNDYEKELNKDSFFPNKG